MNSQVVRVFGVGHNKPASDFYLFIYLFLIQHIYSETEIVSSRKTLQREKKNQTSDNLMNTDNGTVSVTVTVKLSQPEA